jgi:hypothetical protein
MRNLGIDNYMVEVTTQEGTKQVPYDVKKSLIAVLFGPELRLRAQDLLERDKLARKIDECKEDSILLEEAEYGMVKSAVDSVSGFSRDDVEFVKRVFEASQVEVQKKE